MVLSSTGIKHVFFVMSL